MRVGKRLRELREERSMTQAELAKILGKSRAAIGKYETGDRMPDNAMLHALCDYFDVSMDFLLGRDGSRDSVDLYTALSMGSTITFRGRSLSGRQKQQLMDTLEAMSAVEEKK